MSEHTKHSRWTYLLRRRSIDGRRHRERAGRLLEQTAGVPGSQRGDHLFGAGADVPLRTSLERTGDAETMRRSSRAGHGAARLPERRAGRRRDARVGRPRWPSTWKRHGIAAARSRGEGETRLVGLIGSERLGARPGSAGGPGVFETLAGHAGMSLEFTVEQRPPDARAAGARSARRSQIPHRNREPRAVQRSCTVARAAPRDQHGVFSTSTLKRSTPTGTRRATRDDRRAGDPGRVAARRLAARLGGDDSRATGGRGRRHGGTSRSGSSHCSRSR